MILLVHPGTQYSYQLAKQLARHQKLSEFWTGFALAKESWYTQVIESYAPYSWRRRINNRIICDVPAKNIRTKPLLGLKPVYQLSRGRSSQKVFYEFNGDFQNKLPSSSIKRASAVIGFDTASWILAQRAKEFNKPFFLDQSTAHPLSKAPIWRKVAAQFPEWREKLEPRVSYMLEAETREHQLATRIVVASTYTKQTLISQGVAADKLVVNPYGVDTKKFHPAQASSPKRSIRFLYLGAVSAMKGVPLLVETWQALGYKNSELWLVGSISEQERELIPLLPGLKVLGKHPHNELPELLRQCDVLVFPSYSDGFGLVLLEALASGLPVITTEATGGPDIIKNGKEGFIVQSGKIDELRKAMEFFVQNPEKLQEISGAARSCAERFTWEAYGDRWNRLLEEYV